MLPDSPPGNESRPERRLEATDDCWAAVSTSVKAEADTTCPRCFRVLTSRRSIRLGYGRDCWAKVCQVEAAVA